MQKVGKLPNALASATFGGVVPAKWISVSFAHELNALLEMLVTLAGIVIVVSPVPVKA